FGIVMYEQFRGVCSILKRGPHSGSSKLDADELRRMKRVENWGILTTIVALTALLGLGLHYGAYAACVPADARYVVSNGWPLSFFVSFFYSIAVGWVAATELMRARFRGKFEAYARTRHLEYKNSTSRGRYSSLARPIVLLCYGKII